jgi:hypothetical protein
LFTNILTDYENFIIRKKINDVEINETTKGVINNIMNSENLTATIIERNRGRRGTGRSRTVVNTINPSGNRNTSFCIFTTPLVCHFDQTNLTSIKKFYSKENEIEVIGNRLKDRLRQIVVERVYNALGRREEDDRVNNQYDKLYNNKKVKSLTKSLSATNSPVITKTDHFTHTPVINSRLYKKPEKEEQILTKEFVVRKLNEYKDNCVLTKKVHIKDIVKRYKLNLKSAKPLDVGKKLEDTGKMINDYEFMKKSPKVGIVDINRKKMLYPKALVETNSNYYIRLNRNNMGPTISKFPINQLDMRIKDNLCINGENSFYKNIPNSYK